MPIAFYDPFEPAPRQGLADVDRVYQFAWREFTDADWATLDRVYKGLPGWRGYEQGLPWWFGHDDETPPHLTASVEPPGLQVMGLLPASEFESWHDAFVAGVGDLPKYESD